jgi:hypothetical protein
LIRRAIAAALLATVAGALAAPAFATEDDRSQICVGFNKKEGGNDNICIDLGDPDGGRLPR